MCSSSVYAGILTDLLLSQSCTSSHTAVRLQFMSAMSLSYPSETFFVSDSYQLFHYDSLCLEEQGNT